VQLIGGMAACYPNTQVSRETIKGYVSMLKDIPLDVLIVCVEQAIADCEFFPTIKVLRERMFNLTSHLSLHPSAAEAWGTVLTEIGRTGSYRQPHFENPFIDKVIQIMGWRELCLSDNQVADRAHFMKNYDCLMNRAVQDAKLLSGARALRQSMNGPPLYQAGDDDHFLSEAAVLQ